MVKSINKSSLEQNVPLKKNATLTYLYEPMYLELDDYPSYSDKISDIFETQINSNLRHTCGGARVRRARVLDARV